MTLCLTEYLKGKDMEAKIKQVRIIGDWDDEVAHYEDNFKRDYLDKTLKDIGGAHGDKQKEVFENLNYHNIVHARDNIARNGRGFIDPETMPVLESMRYLVGLEDVQLCILRYRQGETNLWHRDYIPKYDHVERPGLKMKDIDDYMNRNYVRCLLMLEDRKPGQFMQTGDAMRNDWKKGDFFYYDGSLIFHSAGSAGPDPRYVLRITGEPTERFWQFLEQEEVVL